jgi:hypothetical protein
MSEMPPINQKMFSPISPYTIQKECHQKQTDANKTEEDEHDNENDKGIKGIRSDKAVCTKGETNHNTNSTREDRKAPQGSHLDDSYDYDGTTIYLLFHHFSILFLNPPFCTTSLIFFFLVDCYNFIPF